MKSIKKFKLKRKRNKKRKKAKNTKEQKGRAQRIRKLRRKRKGGRVNNPRVQNGKVDSKRGRGLLSRKEGRLDRVYLYIRIASLLVSIPFLIIMMLGFFGVI